MKLDAFLRWICQKLTQFIKRGNISHMSSLMKHPCWKPRLVPIVPQLAGKTDKVTSPFSRLCIGVGEGPGFVEDRLKLPMDDTTLKLHFCTWGSLYSITICSSCSSTRRMLTYRCDVPSLLSRMDTQRGRTASVQLSFTTSTRTEALF